MRQTIHINNGYDNQCELSMLEAGLLLEWLEEFDKEHGLPHPKRDKIDIADAERVEQTMMRTGKEIKDDD